MKRYLVIAALSSVLVACSKNPSNFVGSWQSSEAGFFSTRTIVLQFNKDGTCSINASYTVGGVGSLKSSWEVKGKKLLIHESNGEVSEFDVLGSSETELVLKEPESGKITNYRRIGN